MTGHVPLPPNDPHWRLDDAAQDAATWDEADATAASLAATQVQQGDDETALAALTARVTVLENVPPGGLDSLAFGFVALDLFAGATDDDKMANALSYIGAQTYKPTLVLSNRRYDFADTYPLALDGFRLHGPLGGFAREFRNNTEVHCPTGGLFSVVPGHADFAIEGISFVGTPGGVFMTPTTNVLTDCNISRCGFQGFANVMRTKILRCNLSDWYVNGATGTQLDVGGSDSVLFEGMNFMSGSQMPHDTPFARFGSLSQTKVGKMYVTPTNGHGLLIDAGDDCEGLILYDWVQTAWHQDGATSPTGCGIEIRGGQAITFKGGVLFNPQANPDPATKDKGDIMVTGGTGHIFEDWQFVGTHEGFTSPDQTHPAIYTTVPIVVRSPRFVGGRPAVLQQSKPGLITCDDPTVQVVTAV
jgi:hypothetical protein